jgi:hypothetical protein
VTPGNWSKKLSNFLWVTLGLSSDVRRKLLERLREPDMQDMQGVNGYLSELESKAGIVIQ